MITAGAARAQNGLRLVNKQKGEGAFGGAFAALGEQIAHLALGFAHPHVQNLRPLDMEEELRMVHAGVLADLPAQIVGGGLAQQGLAAAGRTVKKKALGDIVLEALEQGPVQKGQFDGVADALHRLVLAADRGPRNRGDGFQDALDAFAGADDFQGDALVGVEPHFHARLELFLGEEGGAEQDGAEQAGFLADAQASARQQLVNAHNRSVAVEAETLHDGEGLVEQNALADLQAGQGDLRIQAADIIGPAGADVRLVGFHRHEESADAVSRGAEFFDDSVQFFDGLAGLVVDLLHLGHAVAQIDHVQEGQIVRRQLAGDHVNQLERGKGVQFFAGEERIGGRGNGLRPRHRLTAGRRGFERSAARDWLFLGFSHCHTVIRVADFATGGRDFFKLKLRQAPALVESLRQRCGV